MRRILKKKYYLHENVPHRANWTCRRANRTLYIENHSILCCCTVKLYPQDFFPNTIHHHPIFYWLNEKEDWISYETVRKSKDPEFKHWLLGSIVSATVRTLVPDGGINSNWIWMKSLRMMMMIRFRGVAVIFPGWPHS